MTKADKVRKHLTDNPTGNCKEAYQAFIGTGEKMHYSQFNTIFRKYCGKNDIEIVKASKEQTPESLPYEEKPIHNSSFPMKVWKDLQPAEMVTEESIGKTVEIAGDSIQYKVKAYHHKGDPMWPVADGVTVQSDKYGQRYMYLECLKISS